jgi:hypothetical protein
MKDQTSSSDPLPNPRHEAFAREVASGRNVTQAYLNVYSIENRHVASTGGSRLMRRKCIVARIKAFQQAGAAGVALDLREIHDFLARVVRTPAGHIVPSSDLCTRVKHSRDGATDVWMPNKLACLRLSAKLQGFLDKSNPARMTSPTGTAHPASWNTTSPSQPPDASATSEPSHSHAPFILTEEQREILMAQRRATIEAYKKQAKEEERLAQQKPPAEPEHPTVEKRPSESLTPDNQKPRQGSMPVRPEPPRQAGPLKPKLSPAIPGPWIPHWRQEQTPPPQNGAHRTSSFRVTPDSSSGIVII